MTTVENYNRALTLAVAAHGATLDKGGKLYIFHPIRVAISLEAESEKIVGLLHDTVEDTDLSLAEISEYFNSDIAASVDLLTRREGDVYAEYIERLKVDPVARAVKIADLKDNLLPDRQYPGRNDERYEAALGSLM